MNPDAFADLLARVRSGREDAAAELVRHFQPVIVAFIRSRLDQAPELRRQFDTGDICNSVLGRLLARLRAGAGGATLDLDRPEDLARLLTAMARNSLNNKYEAAHAAKRDFRPADVAALELLADPGPTPSEVAMRKELLARLRDLLSPFEFFLAEQRGEERGWDEIAADVGSGATADALRKRLRRAGDAIPL